MPSMKILLAEDEQTVARLVTQVLTTMGHIVTGVRSCSEAIEQLHAPDFDLVLLDLHLADGDGYRVFDALRSEQIEAPPIVVMTGEHEPEDDPRSTQAAAILHKPFDIEQLERTVLRFSA